MEDKSGRESKKRLWDTGRYLVGCLLLLCMAGKSAKDNEYVQNSYNGTAEVTGKEADLAAAWDFMTKPSGSGNEVIDLTGRHTAKIIGTYEWQRIVE